MIRSTHPSVAGAAAALALLATAAAAPPALAALTPAQFAQVKAAPPPGASEPMDLAWRDARGGPVTLRAAGDGRPVVLVFADYGCTTLCGPALAIVGARLAQSGLVPGRDYRLAVLGLNPASRPAAARAFVAPRLPAPVLAATSVLTGGAPTITAATRALGYGYVYDAETRAFAHPVAAYVLAPDGRLSALLSEVALTAPALRDAVRAAAAPRAADAPAPSFIEQVALVCHGALAAVGRFDRPSLALLRTGGVLTLLAGAAAAVLMARRRRSAS